ncbi:MAG: YheT family hydrolase [Deltaproteobacteria bacterium]
MPDFRPHPLLPTGHLQTLAGIYLSPGARKETARQHRVLLPDSDQIILHDDCPADWQPGARTALMIHGLAGCHGSPYMRRIAARLNDRGVRTFRMDLRGCGAGAGLARLPYHSGRSEDAAAALRKIADLCPGSPTTLIGFSLGGNITLKLLGESPADLTANLDRAVAICPPVDLLQCVQSLARGVNRLYDRHFVRLLVDQVATQRRLIPDAPALDPRRLPRGVYEFDEAFTAPVCGFGTAANYYRLCSSNQFVPQIQVPTLIVAAADDPLIPGEVFTRLRLPPPVTMLLTGSGGHLGFIGRRNGDPDRRWMDWRVVEWAVP